MDNNIKIKIKFLSNYAKEPRYATSGSAGVDLHACLTNEDSSESPRITIKPGEIFLVSTGIALKIPDGIGGFIFARSGLASKRGIALANGVGVIDSDYVGEIKVPLINLSAADYILNNDERIAQIVFMPHFCANFLPTQNLEETARGGGGFGSTGL
jgi:dUTP pyrophosphatase